jgi:hypothetical protein
VIQTRPCQKVSQNVETLIELSKYVKSLQDAVLRPLEGIEETQYNAAPRENAEKLAA